MEDQDANRDSGSNTQGQQRRKGTSSNSTLRKRKRREGLMMGQDIMVGGVECRKQQKSTQKRGAEDGSNRNRDDGKDTRELDNNKQINATVIKTKKGGAVNEKRSNKDNHNFNLFDLMMADTPNRHSNEDDGSEYDDYYWDMGDDDYDDVMDDFPINWKDDSYFNNSNYLSEFLSQNGRQPELKSNMHVSTAADENFDKELNLDVLEHTMRQLVTTAGVKDWATFFSLQGEFSLHANNHRLALTCSLSSDILNAKPATHIDSNSNTTTYVTEVNKDRQNQAQIIKSEMLNAQQQQQQISTADGSAFEATRNGLKKPSASNQWPAQEKKWRRRESECSSSSSKDSTGTSSLCYDTESCESKYHNTTTHLRNLAVNLISFYQLNQRAKAEEIKTTLLGLPYGLVSSSLSQPLVKAVEGTLDVIDFLPSLLKYLEESGDAKDAGNAKNTRNAGVGTKLQKQKQKGGGSSADEMDDWVMGFSDGHSTESLDDLMFVPSANKNKKAKFKKSPNRIIDLDAIESQNKEHFKRENKKIAVETTNSEFRFNGQTHNEDDWVDINTKTPMGDDENDDDEWESQ